MRLLLFWTILATSLHASTAFNSTEDDALLWGTYRPNLYFGLKPKLPLSLLTGLAWFGLKDYQGFRGDSYPNQLYYLS